MGFNIILITFAVNVLIFTIIFNVVNNVMNDFPIIHYDQLNLIS